MKSAPTPTSVEVPDVVTLDTLSTKNYVEMVDLITTYTFLKSTFTSTEDLPFKVPYLFILCVRFIGNEYFARF